ncbi:MAG: cob(I)yrinic acid a,c-diamide adenosyltransferase [Anaerovoracaceae bacterium]
MDKGFIQVYTGDGKGKTTAALGLALRCLCGGYKVFFGQFMKGRDYSELKAVAYFTDLTMEQYGAKEFVKEDPSDEEILKAQEGLSRIGEALRSGGYKLVVLDEVNTAIDHKLLDVMDVIEVLEHRYRETEVVLTGRNAPPEIIGIADLVTEMREIKHYYSRGVRGRRGIEY